MCPLSLDNYADIKAKESCDDGLGLELHKVAQGRQVRLVHKDLCQRITIWEPSVSEDALGDGFWIRFICLPDVEVNDAFRNRGREEEHRRRWRGSSRIQLGDRIFYCQ